MLVTASAASQPLHSVKADSAEISRLRNSIAHLEESQSELLSALEEEEDADLRSAWQENQGTM